MEALVAQPTEMLDQLDQGLKRRSESELAHLTKKVRKQIMGPAKRSIRLALKELGFKQEDFTYLDGLTPKDYLNQLLDRVVMMAGRVNDHDLVSPTPIKSTEGLIPCDNMSMSQMVELGIKEVEGILHCPHCESIQKTKVDWREGFVCLASNLVDKMFKVVMKPPSNLSFKVFCSSCFKESVPCPSPDKGWNFLFLSFTYTVGLCPKEAILGYLQEKQIEIPLEVSQDISKKNNCTCDLQKRLRILCSWQCLLNLIPQLMCGTTLGLDLDDCHLNEAYLDTCHPITAQPTEKLDRGKRRSESEVPQLTKKMRKQIIVGRGKIELFLALTQSIGLCSTDTLIGYLRGQHIEVPAETPHLHSTFYWTIISQFDPTHVGWKMMSLGGCS